MVLLVVDTQKLITNQKLYNFNVFENAVKTLIASARENGVEVIYIRHDDGAGAELTKGTPGFEIYEGFNPLQGEKIFDKTVNSSFRGTGVLEYLEGRNVRTVVVVGLQTDYCIDATIKCGFEHGFKMIVPENANSTFDNAYMTGEQSYRYYNEFMWKGRYAECISVEETIERMKGEIPDDIKYSYVTKKESDTIISNYYRYYSAFTRSGIVDIHEGSVNWIMPKEGEKGPAIVFQVHLHEDTAEVEIQNLIAGIRAKEVPAIWHITPDSTPSDIVEIMKRNGFKDLGENAPEPEPTMLLKKNDFKPYIPMDSSVTCRKVHTKKDFQAWIDVVNTALHGWDMIDAENYYTWVEDDDINIYLGEINGVPVSTVATIKNGDVASLEFVSTLEAYRRRKVALTVCSQAIQELVDRDVKAVTLGACGDSSHLYKKLGFRSYFNNIVMQYEGVE